MAGLSLPAPVWAWLAAEVAQPGVGADPGVLRWVLRELALIAREDLVRSRAGWLAVLMRFRLRARIRAVALARVLLRRCPACGPLLDQWAVRALYARRSETWVLVGAREPWHARRSPRIALALLSGAAGNMPP